MKHIGPGVTLFRRETNESISRKDTTLDDDLTAVIECGPLSFYAMQRPTVLELVLDFAATGPVEINSAARKLAQALERICRGVKTLY